MYPEEITITDRINLGYFYALVGKKDEAFEQLYIVAEIEKYEHYEILIKDKELEALLHSDKRWDELGDFYKRLKEE